MAYKYYCTGCGRELSQETVLVNMEPVLRGNTKESFQQLTFRMTLPELVKLYESGTPTEYGWRHCKFSFSELMRYIANVNNLKDDVIATLTLADIEDYTRVDMKLEEGQAETSMVDDLFGDVSSPVQKAEMASQVQETEKRELCPAIKAILDKNKKIQQETLLRSSLDPDFNLLKSLFTEGNDYEFELKLVTEPDNDKNDVIVGYEVQNGWPKHTTPVSMARICPQCLTPVFDHAGTAEHKSIVFIGSQKTGKTSTIVSLVHYAENGSKVNLGNKIWSGSNVISDLETIEVLSKSEPLIKDLEDFKEGYAPKKTDVKRENAYVATFRIRNNHQGAKYYLLTLTDIPGDICNEGDGTIDHAKVNDEFMVALSCQAYILCFDAAKAVSGEAQKIIYNVCSWASKFQKLRFDRATPDKNGSVGNAPIMILYTKCAELEDPVDAPDDEQSSPMCLDLVKRSHVFYEEGRLIDRNPIYKYAGEQMMAYDNLRECYQARLRVSPFGYPAPSREEATMNKVLPKTPMPKQIDKLMRWILELTGAIPTAASYRSTLDSSGIKKVEQNYITRPQYITTNPGGNGNDEQKFREALARCYLFSNPGYFDNQYVRCHGNRVMLKKLLFEEIILKKGNK